MHDILDLPEVRERIPRLTVEEYHRQAEVDPTLLKTELIRGVIIKKMPKSPLHASIIKLLYDALNTATESPLHVRFDNPLTLADSEPEPDIAVVRGTPADYFTAHPTTAQLVVKIAVSSVALDRENSSLYAEAGVQEYWIILAKRREVEVYRQPEGGRYREVSTVSGSDVIECTSVPSIRIPLTEIFPA